jgi:2-(1,2-epoxy-1,2-dihydrophenyl)acetyl-CoA isomerase
MRCISCGVENPADASFCGECAAPLASTLSCPSCGKANPAKQKFCNGCGGQLQAAATAERVADSRSYTPKHLAEKILTSRSALEGERKQVTVLFADVQGSMALAEQIDPEDWHRIMDRFFQILSEGVHRFEGTINQFTGDGIMALFGAPIAHEDHAAQMRHCSTDRPLMKMGCRRAPRAGELGTLATSSSETWERPASRGYRFSARLRTRGDRADADPPRSVPRARLLQLRRPPERDGPSGGGALGAGKAFCAGGDVKEFNDHPDRIGIVIKELTTYLHGAVSRLARTAKAVIMAVNGVAAGGGMSLALAGDLVVAAESAKFTMAYSKIAASPDGSSSYFLPRMIGLRRALELHYTNRVLLAREAMDWGLVNRVHPDAEFPGAVATLAKELAQGPTLAFGRAKLLFHQSTQESLETQMELEAQAIAASGHTEDFKNGVAAFAKKQQAVFHGR